MLKQEVLALFTLAEIEALSIYQLANEYIPLDVNTSVEDFEYLKHNPWWLVKTKYGLIKIGWRKRVINIDWSDTKLRDILITFDNVTKFDTGVHASDNIAALRYLTEMRKRLEKGEYHVTQQGSN